MEDERYTVEDRVYKCPNALCQNVLRIQVQICNTEEVDIIGRHFVSGSIRYITAISDDPLWVKHPRTGCCISYSAKYPHGYLKRKFEYGPVAPYKITFIHCQNCYTRVGWKKFQKVDV